MRARFEAIGLADDLGVRLRKMDVPVRLLERMAEHRMPWVLLRAAVDAGALQGAEDANGLWVLRESGASESEMMAWIGLGSLDAACRLALQGVTPGQADSYRRGEPDFLRHFLCMLTKADASNVRPPDVSLFFAGGVLVCKPPYLDPVSFSDWRRLAVRHVGWPKAALACAAGLSVREALQLVEDGSFDGESLMMLALLRFGSLPAVLR